ncbi:hypothetical protein DC415_06550 [Agrobacterium tumefaciens]|nr:hypothetical protein DC415_06550 [Agrobacterium tumefaciens]PVE77469.1 hypothetical protein DCP16_06550 [Sphingomonas sp. TPD3009]
MVPTIRSKAFKQVENLVHRPSTAYGVEVQLGGMMAPRYRISEGSVSCLHRVDWELDVVFAKHRAQRHGVGASLHVRRSAAI